MGYSPWGGNELDTSEELSMHACEVLFVLKWFIMFLKKIYQGELS